MLLRQIPNCPLIKHAPTSKDISNQVKQLYLEPEPDLSIHSTFEE